jgi:hypothetical protein
METAITVEQPLRLVVTEEDLDPRTRGVLRSLSDGAEVYGSSDNAEAALFDALPTVIAKKLRSITPPDFVISEVQMKFTVDAKIAGTGLSGDVSVKFAPSRPTPE